MGPLAGIRVIEFAGIGPAPFCAMLLSHMGAEVLRIDRKAPSNLGIPLDPKFNLLHRGRPSVAVDLKATRGAETVASLIDEADVLIEGFRPGVMERLGLGPDTCLKRNPRLIYGRVTGWGQDGPMAKEAGHDINYIALSGALHCIGPTDGKPTPPLNLVGDFGGGAMFLAFGIVSALLEARRSGHGQVVDASMAEGAAYLMTAIFGLSAAELWSGERGANILDGGAPYYNVYETADGKYVCVGSIESKFYANLMKQIGLDREELPEQNDRSAWQAMRERLAGIFKRHTRDEWCERMQGADVCFAPVLDLKEVSDHAHNKARGTFVEVDGAVQPAPAPRFSRTQPELECGPTAEKSPKDILAPWGLTTQEIAALEREGIVGSGEAA